MNELLSLLYLLYNMCYNNYFEKQYIYHWVQNNIDMCLRDWYKYFHMNWIPNRHHRIYIYQIHHHIHPSFHYKGQIDHYHTIYYFDSNSGLLYHQSNIHQYPFHNIILLLYNYNWNTYKLRLYEADTILLHFYS